MLTAISSESRTDTSEASVLYLELLKKTLVFSLWEDPGKPIEAIADRAGIFRPLLYKVCALLARARMRVVVLRDMEQERRVPGSTWPSYAHTMVGLDRLQNLQQLIEVVLRDNVPGDLIETGVWRGGSCILMKAVLKVHGDVSRRVFVADSFQGLPKPDAVNYPSDAGDRHHSFDFLRVSKEQVEENFRKYGLLDERVVFLKGWFKDTLPTAPIERLSVMRLDGDMYESTMDGLKNLYSKLSVGGFCIIDDYALPNCRAAVNDFRNRRGISDPLVQIDYSGCYWRKSASAA